MPVTQSPPAATLPRPSYPPGDFNTTVATRGRAAASPNIGPLADAPRVVATTRAEAHEARRRAAEIGDYALAERWYRCERALAARDLDAKLQ